MRHSIFEGSATAVVTPMNGYGNLDFDAFGRLLEWMIREGTDAVVVNGTTGESATLDDKEKMAVIRYAVRQVDGQDSCYRGYEEQLYGACGGAVQKGPGAGGGCPAAGDALLQ
ncbi:MAG: dihydrodipicolinate synthase family protein [Enterocloster clostridioformis]